MPDSNRAVPNERLSDAPEARGIHVPAYALDDERDNADLQDQQPAPEDSTLGGSEGDDVHYSEPVYVEVITEEAVEYVPPAAPPPGSEIPGKDDYLLTSEEADDEFPSINEQEPGVPPQSDSIDDEGSEDGELWPDDLTTVRHDTHPLPAQPETEPQPEDR